MRFEFDKEKSRSVKRKPGVSLKEAQDIFDQAYIVDQKNDNPEQFRAIGWSRGRLCSVIFEIRRDASGEYYRLVTVWKATKEEEAKLCRKRLGRIPRQRKTPTADEIAELASRGEDISRTLQESSQ